MTMYTSSGTFECQFGREELPAWYFKKSGFIFLSLQLADCMNGYQATAPRAAELKSLQLKLPAKQISNGSHPNTVRHLI